MKNSPALRKGFAAGGWLDDVILSEGPSERGRDEGETVDQFWMKEALRESLKAIGRCNPNPAVGCVIVRNGVEIARGHTQAYGGLHAERSAIAKLKDRELLRDATAYVTLE